MLIHSIDSAEFADMIGGASTQVYHSLLICRYRKMCSRYHGHMLIKTANLRHVTKHRTHFQQSLSDARTSNKNFRNCNHVSPSSLHIWKLHICYLYVWLEIRRFVAFLFSCSVLIMLFIFSYSLLRWLCGNERHYYFYSVETSVCARTIAYCS